MLIDSLSIWLASGKRRIDQVMPLAPEDTARAGWLLYHPADADTARAGGSGLEAHHGTAGAREQKMPPAIRRRARTLWVSSSGNLFWGG